MAIKQIIKDFEENLFKTLQIKYEGLNLLELGDQIYNKKAAKEYYIEKGVNHTSIDLNGRNGSIPLDLSKPISFDKKFDVVTNYGTTEHVENQYECFKNIHNLCKLGGIMIHGVPLIGHWRNHCRYYYSELFFKQLALHSVYGFHELTILTKDYCKNNQNLVLVVFRKMVDNEFMLEETFNQMKGVEDTKNYKKTQNYTK